MIEFIISINKISLIAFFATLGYLIYEFNLLKKEQKSKKTPTIPQFKESYVPKLSKETVKIKSIEDKPKISKKDYKNFLILTFFLIFFAILTLIGFFYRSNLKEKTYDLISPVPTVEVKVVESSGIFIYDSNFKLLDEADLKKLSNNSPIIIGIKTISDTDIDKARIRVNKNYWELTDITTKFNKKNQVFYITYNIASNESKLKIEAQLHSKTEGWLGE